MGEIFKIPQKTGERGRPQNVKVVGAKREEKEPKIVGARVPEEPTIMDRTVKQDQPEIEVTDHTQRIAEDQYNIRKRPRNPGDPEVNLVTHDRDNWERVKND